MGLREELKEIAFVLAIGICVALNVTIVGLLFMHHRATRWEPEQVFEADADTKVLWPKEDK